MIKVRLQDEELFLLLLTTRWRQASHLAHVSSVVVCSSERYSTPELTPSRSKPNRSRPSVPSDTWKERSGNPGHVQEGEETALNKVKKEFNLTQRQSLRGRRGQ